MMLEEANKERPDDVIHKMIASLKKDLDRAHKLWPGELSEKRFKAITEKMNRWESKMFPDKKLDIVTLSSLGLAMLDELMMYIKDDQRLACIADIHNGLIKIHQHFDPEFDEPELFELADRAFDAWKAIQNES
jgi:hypothetical protein